MSTVLVVATHPDDETLGCGGTLLKHRDSGERIFWLIVTAMRIEEGYSAEAVSARQAEIQTVAELYGFAGVEQLGLPTTKLDQIPIGALVADISRIFNQIRPRTIYLPFRGDIHSDHQAVCRAALSAAKSFRAPFIRRMLMMEVLSETEFAPPLSEAGFAPNVFVDISDYLPLKLEIMGRYAGQLGRYPFPRSHENIQALATFRGATAGVTHAEAFMLLKEIIR